MNIFGGFFGVFFFLEKKNIFLGFVFFFEIKWDVSQIHEQIDFNETIRPRRSSI